MTTSAAVVGSGPNGLAAAVTLARAGLDVTVLEAADTPGGGVRSNTTTLPGLVVDHCSAVHPMAVGSPFLQQLELERYGLRWCLPDIDCVHPLDDGTAGVLHRSVDDTAAGLGRDGARWRRLFAGPSEHYDELANDILGPLIGLPTHPIRLARFGIPALLPVAALARLFRTEQARALFAGAAAHAFRPFGDPLSSSIGLGILTAGHRHGWAVAEGGSQRIADALIALLEELGGTVRTNVRVESLDDVPAADVTVWDLSPEQVARILGTRQPKRSRRAYRRFRRGPAAFKIDLAVEGGIPWTAPDARRAGTVHLGGNWSEVAANEAAVVDGAMPERPFVLVGQQYLADPTRSSGDLHPIWAYAHVPHGHRGDATEQIIDQIERFAPGARARTRQVAVTGPAAFEAANANFGGGDIMTGAKDLRQLVLGPRATVHPYDVGLPGHFICSAATPPGPGAHGMCGANAAQRALDTL